MPSIKIQFYIKWYILTMSWILRDHELQCLNSHNNTSSEGKKTGYERCFLLHEQRMYYEGGIICTMKAQMKLNATTRILFSE